MTTSGRDPMCVLIADDQPQVRSALRLLLMQRTEPVTVEEAADLAELRELRCTEPPDLVLLDWELPDQGGCAALEQVRAAWPQATVIVLSGLPESRQAALSAGADAFVSKGDPPEQLIDAVRQCRLGEAHTAST